ncbi:hypothetical protein FSP39_022498 [Pinctada imbricata]|uniref:Integrase catalytic domain-containing protein n=1 Tax=Pinctada imbricata TaxID=66713 RepID=A0AA88XSK9_PINIB|nr:hypothetical protein FSP39_022498 [Pinctada imbricata]
MGETSTKQKTDTVLDGFKKILSGSRKPKSIRTDKGSEFINKKLGRYFKEKNIKLFHAQNETKANYAERYIQTLKKRLYRYITHFQKYKYLNILQDVVQSINNTPNRSLNGRTPASVNKDNEEEVRLDSYLIRRKSDKVKTKTMSKPKPYTLKIGDQVRITHLKRVFQRDYDQTYTEEVFIIKSRHISQGIPIYKLLDMMDEPILGSFYANELQKVTKDENTVWRIEKILKEKKTKDRTEVKVRWAGWPNKFDSWIAKGDIKDT